MITLEQRAETLMVVSETERHLNPQKARRLIVEAFRLLIEDCAKICDEQAGAMHGVLIDAGNDYGRAAKASAARDMARKIGSRIRNLADPETNEETKTEGIE
jgi:hypothetical protein